MNRTYFCIDMKCFYASVECAERGLDPFTTNLVVADKERGKNALCLAISPALKARGVKNRCRISDIPTSFDYIVAKPRMKLYVEYAADIYDVYLDHISHDDIHVYSIDEAFLDVTYYLKRYKMSPLEFAKFLMREIARVKKIPSTVGIGTNLYLAKVALDITAKHSPDHIGFLDEETYMRTLWAHRPITDFWHVGEGSARRLARYGIFDMAGVAAAPEELIYRIFGIDAELLIDHAWGREPCTIADIKAFRPSSKSVSFSQILFEDYTAEKALLVLREMALGGCQEMMRRHVVAGSVSIGVAYSSSLGIPPTGGAMRIPRATSLYSAISEYVDEIFRKTTHRGAPIRRLAISFDVMPEGSEGYDLFSNIEAEEREKCLEGTVLKIKDRFGKNAILRGFDLEDGATARERNRMIGGHNGE